MLGFTEKEIIANFGHLFDEFEKLYGKTEKNIMDEVKFYYDGYLGTPYAKDSLYNAFAIQLYFQRKCVVDNYFSKSGSTKQILLMLKGQSLKDLNEFLQLILQENEKTIVEKGEMITKKEWKVFLDDFRQIAFDSGYLTIFLENGNTFLKIPNQEMRNALIEAINEQILGNLKKNSYESMVFSLQDEKFAQFFLELEQITFQEGKILNLKERMEEVKDQANYEVFLHQACSLAIKEMLIYSKHSKIIEDFEFKNEKTPSKGKTIILKIYIY